MKSHHRTAFIVAVIVALAEVVIIYELWLAGTWLVDGWLISATKTAAFILLFVGSLIAEMQQLSRLTRLLLLVAVVLLGGYQAAINIVVNYSGANIPPGAAEFFDPLLTPLQVKFAMAIADGFVRSSVVVIMWMVTGLVWRGVATVASDDKNELQLLKAQAIELQTEIKHLQDDAMRLQQEAIGSKAWSELPASWRAAVGAVADKHLNGNKAGFIDALKAEVGASALSRARKGRK